MNSQTLDSKPSVVTDRRSTSTATLRSRVGVVLHTYQAQNLLHGRKAQNGKPGIMGLTAFSVRLKTLWHGARHDDPYADWYLLRIEQGLANCQQHYQALFQALDQQLAQLTGFDISLADSCQPQQFSLSLAHPYAFQGLRRLVEYDHLIRRDMTLKHLGEELPTSLQERVKGSGRLLRRVLALPQHYCHLTIDRAAVTQQTSQAQLAQKCMGELPADIQNKQRLPIIRPLTKTDLPTEALSNNPEVTSP
jgi:integrating conjugative element protein (TIGR03761 family)